MSRVYVAGSSRELDRARRAMRSAALAGHELTLDWTKDIDANGGDSMPRTSPGAVADAGLVAVERAQVVWFLNPTTLSQGAWVELGAALALGRRVIVSGPGESLFLFASGVVWFGEDNDAVRAL